MRIRFGCSTIASIGLLGTSLIVIVAYVFLLRYQQVFNSELRALQEQGMPISIADLEPEPVPAEENAATYLRRAQAATRALDIELAEIAGHSGEPASEEFLSRFAEATAAFPEVYDQLAQAAAAANFVPDLDYSLGTKDFSEQVMSESGKFRSTCRVLSYGAKAARAGGDADRAAQLAVECLQVGRKSAELPAIIGYIGGVAMRGVATTELNSILQQHGVSDETRAAIEAELVACSSLAPLQQAFITERAYGVESIKEQNTTWLPMVGFHARGYLDLIEERSRQTSLLDFNGTDPMPMFAGSYGILSVMADKALSQARVATYRLICECRALRIINQLTKLNPETVDLQALGLPEDAITDPYSGKEMIVKRVEGGWSVYSVGPDGKDDGGDYGYDGNRNDIGFGAVTGLGGRSSG